MSDKIKVELRSVDWMKVRMLSIQGNAIQLATEEGPVLFEYQSAEEAKAALEEWFIKNGCNPKASPFPPASG